MAENSKIEWTTSTFNPWLGCTKVSPACKHCYAERDMDKRLGKVAWGPNGTRVVTSDANWRKPLKWNREAAIAADAHGDYLDWCQGKRIAPVSNWHRPRVFCASLADVFEDWDGPVLDHNGRVLYRNRFEDEWFSDREPGVDEHHVTMDDVRRRLFALIDSTPHLDWLLLTKRPENILRMWSLPLNGIEPSDPKYLYRHNVWIGTSVENQEQADKRIPYLLGCREMSPVLFLSCEPLLGPVDLQNIQVSPEHNGVGPDAIADNLRDSLTGALFSGESASFLEDSGPAIDWVIAGGESGPNARPSHPDWFRSLRDQCAAADVPFHFKQFGEWADASSCIGGDWPVQFWEDGAISARVGKKKAGRLLDGVQHDGLPIVDATGH